MYTEAIVIKVSSRSMKYRGILKTMLEDCLKDINLFDKFELYHLRMQNMVAHNTPFILLSFCARWTYSSTMEPCTCVKPWKTLQSKFIVRVRDLLWNRELFIHIHMITQRAS